MFWDIEIKRNNFSSCTYNLLGEKVSKQNFKLKHEKNDNKKFSGYCDAPLSPS